MKKIRRKYIIAAAMAVMAAVVGWIVWTNVTITTSYITIENEKIPEEFQNFRIAAVSDLHNHQWGDELIGRLEKECPDMIVITGDLVDSSHTDFGVAMEFIHRAVEIAPVYYVTGNHEAWLDHYDELEKQLTDSGVKLMDDRKEWLERGDAKISLVGIQDPSFSGRADTGNLHESIVTAKLENLLDQNGYNIILCHRPELFDGYVKVKADLVITGHAHGGQVRIPLIGGLIAPNQGFLPRYTERVYSRGGTDMVVSRGLGNSVIPVRINNMPELVIITLTKPES